MRPHGHFRVSRRTPEARATCDLCGKIVNHNDLQWYMQWQGIRLQNMRTLRCRSCIDIPSEFRKTIFLPPDPIPIANPRPELYTSDDNPVSGLSWDPNTFSQTINGNIGNMTAGGGLDAAFSGYGTQLHSSWFAGGTIGKPAAMSAIRAPSLAGASNYVGKFWGAGLSAGWPSPTQLSGQVAEFGVGSFTVQAPSDGAFLDSGVATLEFDGWNGSSWVSLWTGTSSGSLGETLTVLSSQLANTALYYGHRILITGDGVNRVAVAQLIMNAVGEGQLAAAPGVNPS